MNRERARELLPIIQAFAEGEALQFRLNQGSAWLDLPDNELVTMTFPADDYEYRIKPEPREFWLQKHQDGTLRAYLSSEYCGKEQIHVREVLDDE